MKNVRDSNGKQWRSVRLKKKGWMGREEWKIREADRQHEEVDLQREDMEDSRQHEGVEDNDMERERRDGRKETEQMRWM